MDSSSVVTVLLPGCHTMKIISTLLIVASCAIQKISSEYLVTIEDGVLSGDKIRAVCGDYDFYSFRGIPYAKPPVGNLRFKAPEAPEPWEGIRNASNYGNRCPQFNSISKYYTFGHEDCLFVNVFTMNMSSEANLPVIVHFSGAAYQFDQDEMNLYEPDFMVTKGMVVVTFNQRVGIFGYLALNKEAPGNAGIKDTLAVLKWVQKNIRAFGGDPNKVTALGHSSGSASIVHHIASPTSKGLLHRAVLLSGVPTCDAIYSYEVEKQAFEVSKLLGFYSTDADKVLTFLQSIPHELLLEVASGKDRNNVLFKKMTSFVPVIEKDYGQERVVVQDALTAFKTGNVNTVDLLMSHVNQETVLIINYYKDLYIEQYRQNNDLLAPSKISLTSKSLASKLAKKIKERYFGDKEISVDNMKEFITYANFANMVYDVHRFLRSWPRNGNTYFMKFSTFSGRNYFGQQGVPYGINGSAHGDDQFYLFHAPSLNLPLVEDTLEWNTVTQTCVAITNFAKTGNPTPDESLGVTWPQYDNEQMYYAEFTDKITIRQKPNEADIAFWKEIIEDGGIEF